MPLAVADQNKKMNIKAIFPAVMFALALVGVAVNALNFFVLGHHGHSHGDHDHSHDHGHSHSHGHSHGHGHSHSSSHGDVEHGHGSHSHGGEGGALLTVQISDVKNT